MKRSKLNRLANVLMGIIMAALATLFFTNDFGLVDLRKTSVVIGLGLDVEEDDVIITCQLALPQPAENGENTQFASVSGRGKTVACCLNEINIKTGFYPKLVFCKLIVLGESCFERDVNELLNYFYTNEYSGLTPKLAACKGAAGDLMSLKLEYGDSVTDVIERLLSEEPQKSGNVPTTDLNKFGQGCLSKSGAAYMPYVVQSDGADGERSEDKKTTGEGQGGGSREAGKGASQEENSSQESGGKSGGSQESGKKNGGEQGGGARQTELVCDRTALFEGGRFKGILSQEQTFTLCLLKNPIRHAYSECSGEDGVVLGMKNCKGGESLLIENGAPVLKLSFSAVAKLTDEKRGGVGKSGLNGPTPASALRQCEEQLKKQFEELFSYVRECGCDVFGARDMLYKKNYRYFNALKDVLYDRITLVTEVKLRSAG